MHVSFSNYVNGMSDVSVCVFLQIRTPNSCKTESQTYTHHIPFVLCKKTFLTKVGNIICSVSVSYCGLCLQNAEYLSLFEFNVISQSSSTNVSGINFSNIRGECCVRPSPACCNEHSC